MTHPSNEQLAAWIDRRLAGDEKTAIDRHLVECPDCRRVAINGSQAHDALAQHLGVDKEECHG